MERHEKWLLKHYTDPDGLVDLYHFAPHETSGQDALTTDPSKFGKNTWSASERKAEGTPKTFFYTDLADKERFFGGRPLFHTRYPAKHLYDATEDKDGLASGAYSIHDLILKIARAGYHGMFYSGEGYGIRTVAAFRPVDMKALREPKKLSRKGPPMSDHDAMLHAAAESNGDATPFGALADLYDETGRAGSGLLRAHAHALQHGLGNSFLHEGRTPRLSQVADTINLTTGEPSNDVFGAPGGVDAHITAFSDGTGALSVRHEPEAAGPILHYTLHIRSLRHLIGLLGDSLPKPAWRALGRAAFNVGIRHRSSDDAPERLARTRMPVGGAITNGTFSLGGQFGPKPLASIRQVMKKIGRRIRRATREGPEQLARPYVDPDPEGTKTLTDWLEKTPQIAGVYGLPEFEKAVSEGRRLTHQELRSIEDTFSMPEHHRLSTGEKPSAGKRLHWLDHVHNSLMDRLGGPPGLAKLLRRKDLPESAQIAVQRAVKLGYLLTFHKLLRKGFPEAPDPLEWYGTSMDPLDATFHGKMTEGGEHPQWGKLNPTKDGLDSGGKAVWDHAPASTVMRAIVGLTSPGSNPEGNAKTAYKIIRGAVDRAGGGNWIDHIAENQEEHLASWMREHGIEHPGKTSPAKWLASLEKKNPEALKTALSPYREGKTGPIIKKGQLLPKQWIAHAGGTVNGIRSLKRLMSHIRATDETVRSLPEGQEKVTAEMRAVSKWLLSPQPVEDIQRMKGGKLELGFHEGETHVPGAMIFGPKVGEFVPALSGRAEYGNSHVQDMHEAWTSRLALGGISFGPRGGYGDKEKKQTEGLSNQQRRVLYHAATQALSHIRQTDPTHPILKMRLDDRSALQAVQWVGGKLLRDKGGLLDFVHSDPSPFVENKDFVDGANAIEGRKAFDAKGDRRYPGLPKARKTGLQLGDVGRGEPERLARSDRDPLIRAILEDPEEHTPQLAFADHLDEEEMPGAEAVRAHIRRLAEHPNDPDSFAHLLGVQPYGRMMHFIHPNVDVGNGASASVIGRAASGAAKGPVVLTFRHWLEGPTTNPSGQANTVHRVLVHSAEELHRFTENVPDGARWELFDQAMQHLPRPGSPVQLARPDEPVDAPHVVYVSPNQKDESTYSDAVNQLSSPRMAQLAKFAERLPSGFSGKAGIGIWHPPGFGRAAEASYVHRLADPSQLERHMAALGSAFNQKWVLGFRAGEGTDIRHVLRVPSRDREAIDKHLNDLGVEFKTLIHAPEGTQVEAVDFGGLNDGAMRRFASESGALAHERHKGAAVSLGDDDRAVAVQKFRDMLR